MSRIGRAPITVPAGVDVNIDKANSVITVKGPKGTLSLNYHNRMIVALDEAKRKLVALEDVLAELKNQLRIDEAKERCSDLERETMVQDFWSDAEKSSKKLQEIKKQG